MKNKSVGKNIKKKLLNVFSYTLLTLLILPLALIMLFRNPLVQTIAGKMAAEVFSNVIDQKVTLRSVNLSFIDGITVTGLDIYDHHDTSMLYVGELKAMPVFAHLSLSHLHFNKIEIDSVKLRMVSYEGDDGDNLTLMTKKLSGGGSGGGTGFSMFSRYIKLTNSAYTLNNRNRSYDGGPRNMDYANIVIDSINCELGNFNLINDSLNFHIDNLNAREKSGLLVHSLTTDFVISSSCLLTDNSEIRMNNSNINGDFRMFYNGYNSMSSYIDSVEMYGLLKPTDIYIADLGIFSDVLYAMKDSIGITGRVEGTVKDLKTEDLRVKFSDDTRISGDISFKGLPDFFTSKIVATNINLTTNTGDISLFYLPVEQKSFDFTEYFSPDNQIAIAGNFDGYYENFHSDLDITLLGKVINTNIDYVKNNDGLIDMKLAVNSDSLDIGDILYQDYLGLITMKVNAVIKGDYPDNMDYSMSGYFKDVDLFGYNYSRIRLNANYIDDSVNADFRVGDRNLMLSGTAAANLADVPEFKANIGISSAKLQSLGLWMDDYIDIKSDLTADIIGTDINTMNANIRMKNIYALFRKDEAYNMDSLVIVKNTDNDSTNITVSSDIVDATMKGKYQLTDFYDGVLSIVDNYYSIESAPDSIPAGNQNAELSVVLKRNGLVTDQILKGVEFNNGSKLDVAFNFPESKADLVFKTDKVSFGETRVDTVVIKVNTLPETDALTTNIFMQNIILKDSTEADTLVFGIDDLSASAVMRNDSIDFGINWDNRIPTLKNSGVIEGFLAKVLDTVMFSINKADVFVNDQFWTIDSNNLVKTFNDRIYFKDMKVSAGSSEFALVGTVPKENNDSLVAVFKDWNLSYFDLLTRRYNVDLDGSIVGELQMGRVNNNLTLVSNIRISNLGLNHEYLGDAHILNTWDNTNNSVFIKSQIIRKSELGAGEVFLADGYYYPFRDKDNIDIGVSFDRFNLKALEPFMQTIVKELEGTTSGKIDIKGSINAPVITGTADMQRAGMKVVYLNTKYSFSNSIEFEKKGIRFDKLVLYDTLGNKAYVDGSLTYNNFVNPYFDVSISTPKLLFFNTDINMNDLFYGTAIASGDIKFTGSPDDINLNIKTRTQKGTNVTLPLNYSVEISDKDYIIFTNPTQDTLPDKKVLSLAESHKQKGLNYNIDVNMSVNPDALLTINLPADMGKIQARGNSNLDMGVNSNGEFSMVGDYVVENGLFHFTVGNLVSKRFTLVNGGRISWSGNPYAANVNIKGLYKVKTNLASLGITIDSTASYRNKVTVDCYVVLTDELLNPNIKFQIKIPELDPDLQRVVFSELDTTNTAMMNQQMISLLVLGTFSFNNAANVNLQTSYYNVIANQLSSMLSQISKNVDIGLNYKPGDEVSEQEFEVALSTQLFDDRLTIDGNFGMTYDRTEQSASNIVGDVDIGYKLTPDGRWVLKVFNHSNVNSWYNYSNYDQISPYTQGVGIAFRKDFNNIRELFTGRKKDRKKQDNKNEDGAEEGANKEGILKEDNK